MIKMKNILLVLLLTVLLSSCVKPTNTETVITYNKFKKSYTIKNEDNYVRKYSGVNQIAFDVSTHWDDEIEDIVSNKRICFIKLRTINSVRTGMSKGNHLWIYADGKKFDLECLDAGGSKSTVVETSPTYYDPNLNMTTGGYTSTTDTYYEYALFMTDVDQIRQMASAQSLCFEMETWDGEQIQGVFVEKNFIALRNFIMNMEKTFGSCIEK